ncbi:MAG: hypothetical protein JWR34_3410 [Mycobacterium sp.]|nr:hypothetical protein [Mycobacterium sp.]
MSTRPWNKRLTQVQRDAEQTQLDQISADNEKAAAELRLDAIVDFMTGLTGLRCPKPRSWLNVAHSPRKRAFCSKWPRPSMSRGAFQNPVVPGLLVAARSRRSSCPWLRPAPSVSRPDMPADRHREAREESSDADTIDIAAAIVRAKGTRKSIEVVRAVLAAGDNGVPPDRIAKGVGAHHSAVKRVLDAAAYRRQDHLAETMSFERSGVGVAV